MNDSDQRQEDPFRWLEDPDDERTRTWVAEQHASSAPLVSLPEWASFHRTMRGLLVPEVDGFEVAGQRIVFRRRDVQSERAMLVVDDGEAPRVVFDPRSVGESCALVASAASPAGSRFAVQITTGGSDMGDMYVVDDEGRIVDGPIGVGWQSPVAWFDEDRFAFARPFAVASSRDPSLFWHRPVHVHHVGDPWTSDGVIFGGDAPPFSFYALRAARDGRRLLVARALGWGRNDLFLVDLTTGAAIPIQGGAASLTWAVVANDRLVLRTTLDAPLGRVCTATFQATSPDAWVPLISEDAQRPLVDIAVARESVICHYRRDVVSELEVHDLDNGTIRTFVELPGLGSAGLTSDGTRVLVSYEDFCQPRGLYELVGERIDPVQVIEPPVDLSHIVVTQHFATSPDGTRVPMFVIAAQPSEGVHPTILHGYGSSNVALAPHYSPEILAWVLAGGRFVSANLRGGGEYGPSWYLAGDDAHKQNTVDDLAACAEHLIAHGMARPDQLGLLGGSAGGLAVGGAFTQHPELFRAVVCAAPVFDFVRWRGVSQPLRASDDRGGEPATLPSRRAVSPYHRAATRADYPAALFVTFEGDDRVDPAHAYKMCAALQVSSTSGHPVLLRQLPGGHADHDRSALVAYWTDLLAFFATQLGLPVG